MSAGFPRIRIRGDAFERSRQYGEAAREQIRLTRSGYERAFAAKGTGWEQAIAQARGFLPAIEQHAPELIEEIRGIAEGSGLTFDEILTINCRSEILHAATVAKAERIGGFRGECTSFALEPDRTTAGQAVVGQNWDWLDFLSDATILLEVERQDGPNYVSLVEAGLLAKMILTQSGLGIGINTLASSLDGSGKGLPFHFVIRSLADSPHIAGALERISSVPRAASGNYILANADGAVLNVETSPGGPRNARPQISTNGSVVHANHFIDPVPGGHDLAPMSMADSFVRLGRMTRLIGKAEAPLSTDAMRVALSDHAEWPNSICCHPDPGSGPSERWITIASVVMHPSRRSLAYTVGPPCENDWHELDYRELLG